MNTTLNNQQQIASNQQEIDFLLDGDLNQIVECLARCHTKITGWRTVVLIKIQHWTVQMDVGSMDELEQPGYPLSLSIGDDRRETGTSLKCGLRVTRLVTASR